MKEWMWVAGLRKLERGDAALNLIFGILAMAGNEVKNEVAVRSNTNFILVYFYFIFIFIPDN
jgi:hypothetical protein